MGRGMNTAVGTVVVPISPQVVLLLVAIARYAGGLKILNRRQAGGTGTNDAVAIRQINGVFHSICCGLGGFPALLFAARVATVNGPRPTRWIPVGTHCGKSFPSISDLFQMWNSLSQMARTTYFGAKRS